MCRFEHLVLSVFLLATGVWSSAATATLPAPTAPTGFACRPLGPTFMANSPGAASPLGVLSVSNQVALLFELDAASPPVDLYIAAQLPDQSLWLLNATGQWQSYPASVPAYRTQLSSAMALNTATQNLFMAPLASLPPGTYQLYTIVVPTGTDPKTFQWASSPYYLWCFTQVVSQTPGTPPPLAPTVSLSANPTSVASDAASTLNWSSTNATSCDASGAWSGSKALSGSENTGALTSNSSFTLTCNGAGGSASRSLTVTVNSPPPPPTPTVSLAANPTSVAPGTASTLSWSSTNAASCNATDAWSGAKATSGSESSGALTATSNFTLTCTGAGGSANQSATVTVNSPPPPPPPVNGAAEAALLNFAETWAQNWNYGGHSVDARFTSDYGYWSMDDVTYEPWLFDRVSVAYYLYQATGNTRWRDQFIVYFNFYRTHIDAQGIFTPKGFDDTKYSYVTPFLLYERLTGDVQYRPIAKRIYDRWVVEFPNNYSVSIGLWTEREIGLALEAAVSYYELTQDAAALARARALLNHWDQVCAGNRAPLHTLEQHGEEFSPPWSTRRMTSPWMAGLYFQAAMQLHRLTGDTQPLTQLSRYADWLDQYAFVDAVITHPEHAGYFIPYYLVGEDGYYEAETPDWGDADHAYDVGNMLAAAIYAKGQLGQTAGAIETRRAQMSATAINNFDYWTRSTTYLPKYRLSPPRKFNWWYRSRTLQ